jgi:TRAP-type C4-dicarboxylate transport system permease small subunit
MEGRRLEKGKRNIISLTVEYISRVGLVISGVFVLAMAFSSTYGVARRYIFHNPEPYSYEVSTILLIWCFVLSVAALQYQKRHIRGDFLLSRLPKNVQYFIDYLLAPILGLLCAFILCWKAIPGAMFSLSIGEVSASSWKEPIFPTKIVIPIGFGMLCIVIIYQIYEGFAGLRKKVTGKGSEPDTTTKSSVDTAKEGN